MKSRIFKRFAYSLQEFKLEYPISPSTQRQSPLHQIANSQDILEKAFLGPLRHQLVEITTNMWINARMRDKPNDNYLPNEFIYGATKAIPEFFRLLSLDLQNNTQQIRKITTKSLADAFFYHHQQINTKNIKLELRLNSCYNVRKGENWIQLGRNCPSTILNAPIYQDLAPVVFWRHDKVNKLWLFREMNFEYAFEESKVTKEMVQDNPTIAQRTELAKGGGRIAIEAIANIDLTFKITDGTENNWQETINRPMVFRFESESFRGKFEGNWKISDVDNYFLSNMFTEQVTF